MSALLELLPENNNFIERMNKLGIPGVHLEAKHSEKCGIGGTHVSVTVHGEEEESHDVHEHEHHHDHDHEHHHEHEHTHHHHHSGMSDIGAVIDSLDIPEKVREDVKAVYALIAQAESTVHGKPITEVHFHEVGTADAIADITGCALLIHELGVERIVCSPITTGFGQVRCAHGILPVPAPATALILSGVPCSAGIIEGELCTPTGAAIVKHFADEFRSMPQMSMDKIGYGMGNKDFAAANCLRAVLGESEGTSSNVTELACNLDDMTAEEIAYAMEKLFEAGALDVYTTSIGMKKSRPGTMLTVMCREGERNSMAGLIFKHTSTIGIREYKCNRMVMNRSEYEFESEYGNIRIKEVSGYGVTKEKPEFEDLKKIADRTGKSLREIKKEIL